MSLHCLWSGLMIGSISPTIAELPVHLLETIGLYPGL
jgi:hypothetical protein